MKVLWFTNILMPEMCRRLGTSFSGSGHWMSCLLESLKHLPEIQLGVATTTQEFADDAFECEEIAYYLIQRAGNDFADDKSDDLMKCLAVVDKFAPDLVHIHGTERFHGLLAAKGVMRRPAVISLQGLLSEIVKKYFQCMSLRSYIISHRFTELVRLQGLVPYYFRMRKGAVREQRILGGASYVMGRTAWDRAHALQLNPALKYYHVEEILRDLFSTKSWSLHGCRKHSILCTSTASHIRGVDTLLEAVAILKRDYPDVIVTLAGPFRDGKSGYHMYLRKLVSKLALDDNLRATGFLNVEGLVQELTMAHTFVIASLVENSPNSLCEAQLMGLPCVASCAGGIPSLVEDGRTGILFPPGDPALLARAIQEVWESDDGGQRIGLAAREVASGRHDKRVVLDQLLYCYKDILIREGLQDD